MSAQPYSDVEIRAIQCAHDEGIPESVNLAWVRTAEPRWLATVDALTSRLDAATRENARLVKCVKDEWDGEAADKILTNVEELTAALDAATRRADEVGALLASAVRRMRSALKVAKPALRGAQDAANLSEVETFLSKIDAALSTGSTPATTANPGDKADRIDAAKEGR